MRYSDVRLEIFKILASINNDPLVNTKSVSVFYLVFIKHEEICKRSETKLA